MKKSKLQVMIEFLSHLSQLKKTTKVDTKVSSAKNGRKLSVVLALLLIISSSTFATTYYTRTSGGNWNANTTWSTVGYGNATNTGTFPVAGDVVDIGDGYTVMINAAVNCATINIGQGVSGILEFRSTSNYTVNVSGSVTVNTGAKFWYNSAVNRTHQVNIAKNFTNYGQVDFYVGVGQLVNLTFNTNSSSIVSGTGTWDLNNVTYQRKIRDSAAHVALAQSFVPSVTANALRARIYMKKNASLLYATNQILFYLRLIKPFFLASVVRVLGNFLRIKNLGVWRKILSPFLIQNKSK